MAELVPFPEKGAQIADPVHVHGPWVFYINDEIFRAPFFRDLDKV